MFLIKDFLVKTDKKKNRCVFASRDIPAGTVIGDYLGTVIPEKDEDEQTQGLYAMSIDAGAVVLANPAVSGIHWINHSCAPNTALHPVGSHVIYFALRKIFKGEEITVNYLLGMPDRSCNPCKHQCYCGEKNCRGTLHCSTRDVERYLRFEKRIQKDQGWKEKKEPPVPFGTQLPPLKNYPRYIIDDPVYDIFASSTHVPLRYADSELPSRDALRMLIRETGVACFFSNLGITVTAVRERTITAGLST